MFEVNDDTALNTKPDSCPWLKCRTIQPGNNVFNGVAIEGSIEILRHIADVWRREHIVERPVGVLYRQRLNVEDVYGGAGNPMFSQGGDQGAFVDDRAARRIDQPCRGFH